MLFRSNKFIAISANDSMRVDILDSATLKRLQHLGSPQETIAVPMVLAFSPDTRMLTCLGRHVAVYPEYLFKLPGVHIISWDLQTGGVVSTIDLRQVQSIDGVLRAMITYSMNGKSLGVLQEFRTVTILSIYDVVSGACVRNVCHGGTPLRDIWTYGDSPPPTQPPLLSGKSGLPQKPHVERLRLCLSRRTLIAERDLDRVASAASCKLNSSSLHTDSPSSTPSPHAESWYGMSGTLNACYAT